MVGQEFCLSFFCPPPSVTYGLRRVLPALRRALVGRDTYTAALHRHCSFPLLHLCCCGHDEGTFRVRADDCVAPISVSSGTRVLVAEGDPFCALQRPGGRQWNGRSCLRSILLSLQQATSTSTGVVVVGWLGRVSTTLHYMHHVGSKETSAAFLLFSLFSGLEQFGNCRGRSSSPFRILQHQMALDVLGLSVSFRSAPSECRDAGRPSLPGLFRQQHCAPCWGVGALCGIAVVSPRKARFRRRRRGEEGVRCPSFGGSAGTASTRAACCPCMLWEPPTWPGWWP